MKKLLFVLLLFLSIKSFSQYPVKQTLGSDSTIVESKGSLKGRIINKVFTDTIAANLERIKFYDGAQIYTKSGGGALWIRDSTLNKWVQAGSTFSLSSLGSGYKILTSGVKSLFGSSQMVTIDSSSNSNALTFKIDTTLTGMATKNDINHRFLGYRYYDSTSAVTGDLTNHGASYSVSSGNIVFTSGGANDGSQWVSVGTPTCQEQWIVGIGIKVTSKNSTSYGPVIGIHSINPVVPIMTMAQFDMTTGANSGKATMLLGVSYGAGSATSAITFSVGDSVYYELERDVNILTLRLRNVTTGQVATPAYYNFKYTDGGFMHNTGYAAIEQRSDSLQVYKFFYYSKATVGAPCLIGDSKAYGAYANSFYDSYGGQLKNAYVNFNIFAGGGDRVGDFAKRLQEIIDSRPLFIILAIGSNSIRNSESGYIARYDSCVSVLQAALPGTPIYHFEPTPETIGIDQTPLLYHLRTTYPGYVIFQYDEFQRNAAALLDADQVHPNQLGHNFEFNKLIQSGKLPGVKTILNPDRFIKSNDVYDQPVSYKISGTGEITNKLTVGNPAAAGGTAQFRIRTGTDYNLWTYSAGGPDVTISAASDNLLAGRQLYINGASTTFGNYSTGGVFTGTRMVIDATGVGILMTPTQPLSVTGKGYFSDIVFQGTDTLATKAYARSVGGGGGSTPTLQQVLTAGSSVTAGTQSITGTTTNILNFTNFDEFDVSNMTGNSHFAGGGVYNFDADLNINDVLKLTAVSGLHNAADSMLVWNPSSNTVGYRPIPSGGSTSPGGSNTYVQFNNSSAFGGDADFTYTASNDMLNLYASNSSGMVSIGPVPSVSGYGGIWFGETSPALSNAAFYGTTGHNYFKAKTGADLNFMYDAISMAQMTDYKWAFGYGVSPLANTTFYLNTGNTGNVGLALRGLSGQTANLQQWQNDGAAVLAAITAGGVLDLYNIGGAPGSSVTNGVRLYAEDVSSSAELKVRDEAGNVTTLSPHNFSRIPGGRSNKMAWSFYSERGNDFVNVDMYKAVETIEKLSGEVEDLKKEIAELKGLIYQKKKPVKLIYTGKK